jgi:hypothetical protein
LANESPDLILVRLDQFPRRLLIPFPQSPHQVIEGSIRGHHATHVPGKGEIRFNDSEVIEKKFELSMEPIQDGRASCPTS